MSSLALAAASGSKPTTPSSAFGTSCSAFSAHRSLTSSPFSASSTTSSIRRRPPPSSRSSAAPPCKFYARGYCSRGSSCRFRHEDIDGVSSANEDRRGGMIISSSSPAGDVPICSFFLRGTCKRGVNCRFRHESSSSLPPPPTIVATTSRKTIRPQPMRRSVSMRRTAPLETQVKVATSLDRSLEGIRARVEKCRAAVERAERAAAQAAVDPAA